MSSLGKSLHYLLSEFFHNYFHSEHWSIRLFVISFWFTMSDMWRQLKITKLTFVTLRQCILLHMHFPISWNTLFRLHCRISSASIVLTNPCLSLIHIAVLHWKFISNTYSESIEHLTTGLFRIYLMVWDGFIWKVDRKSSQQRHWGSTGLWTHFPSPPFSALLLF